MARDYDDRDRGNFQRDRSVWERTGDEVRSWFGDEEAERRRRLDDMYANRMDQQDRDYQYGRSYGNYPGSGRRDRPGQMGSDDQYERDYDMTYRGSGQTPSGFSRMGGPGYRRDYDFGRHGYDQMDHEGGRYGWDSHQHDSGHFRRRNMQQQGGYYGRESQGESFAGRGPSGYRRSAERISEDLNEALTWDPRLDASNIKVEVEGNIVTLSGSVRDRHSKRRAEDLAESVRGVEDVRNKLDISSGGDYGRHDQQGGSGQSLSGQSHSQSHNPGSHNPGSQTTGQHNSEQGAGNSGDKNRS